MSQAGLELRTILLPQLSHCCFFFFPLYFSPMGYFPVLFSLNLFL